MKIRYGFVSNSSSSSYIVKFKNMSFLDFVECVMGADLGWFNEEAIEERISNDIIDLEDRKDDSILGALIQSKIETYRNYLERSRNIKNDIERVQLVFDLEGIRVEEDNGDLLLNYFTSMHNDFNTGMNDLYKEIIFTFLFDLKKEITCERIDDSM
jgi:hypothetical protein